MKEKDENKKDIFWNEWFFFHRTSQNYRFTHFGINTVKASCRKTHRRTHCIGDTFYVSNAHTDQYSKQRLQI